MTKGGRWEPRNSKPQEYSRYISGGLLTIPSMFLNILHIFLLLLIMHTWYIPYSSYSFVLGIFLILPIVLCLAYSSYSQYLPGIFLTTTNMYLGYPWRSRL